MARFVAFYLPSRRKFFWGVKESLEKAWEDFANLLGWKKEIVQQDSKIVADLEIQDPPAQK